MIWIWVEKNHVKFWTNNYALKNNYDKARGGAANVVIDDEGLLHRWGHDERGVHALFDDKHHTFFGGDAEACGSELDSLDGVPVTICNNKFNLARQLQYF